MARNASPKNSTKTQQNKHKKTKKATTQNKPEHTTTPAPSGVVCAGTRDGAAWTPPPPGAVRARASRTSAVIDIGSLTVPSSGFGVAGQRSSAGRPTSRPGPDVALPAFGNVEHRMSIAAGRRPEAIGRSTDFGVPWCRCGGRSAGELAGDG